MILSNTTQVKPWKDPQSDNNVDHIKIMKMAAVEGGHCIRHICSSANQDAAK
jgi:hypothetical protein